MERSPSRIVPPSSIESATSRQLEHDQAQSIPALALPTDRPRLAIRTFRGGHVAIAFDQECAGALERIGQASATTLEIVLLAAFQTLLYRSTGQADLVVGVAAPGRGHPKAASHAGSFADLLLLRTELSDSLLFRALLERADLGMREVYAHRALPSEPIVAAAHPERGQGHTPLVQAQYRFRAIAERACVDFEQSYPSGAGFELMLDLANTPGGIAGRLIYNCDLFDRSTIARSARHFKTLIAGIVADPLQSLAGLPLLTTAERQQLLLEWNDTAAGVRGQESGVRSRGEACLTPTWLLAPDSRCIHDLFAEQAARTPDAVAVVFEAGVTKDEGRTARVQGSGIRVQDGAGPTPDPWPLTPDPWYLTYAALNARANQLAHHLRALGVGPEVVVGIYMERSAELLVGLLGVLKAGGAYLPLDRALPHERLAFMLGDARARVLLTNDERRTTNDGSSERENERQGDKEIQMLPFSHSPVLPFSESIVDLRADWPVIAREPATNPPGHAGAANLAYAIYTSGSTGTPKGVQIAHGAVVNFLHAMQRYLRLTGYDALLAATTLSFDIAGLELFLPLSVGARVQVVGRDVAANGERLLAQLRRGRATIMQATPAMWRLLIDVGWAGDGGLQILCGGEALARDLADQLLARAAKVWNLYGPTETTIWSAALRVVSAPGPVAIGRPIANTVVYVLDRRLQPLPIGIPGEVYIGGAGVARGYLARADLTAERFVPNPFAVGSMQYAAGGMPVSADRRLPTADCRLYRTGDLGRYLADGTIEYLGRIDHQVKLRGFRIELGEIEALLSQHPSVRQAVVVAHEHGADDKRLATYVVPATNDEGSDSSFVLRSSSFVSELKSFLAARLPQYMVPASFTLLDSLPLTPSGKIDRKRLPAPLSSAEPAERFVAPRTLREQSLYGLWEQILGHTQFGVHDDFFDLGGHSLLATRVISGIRQIFKVDLSLQTFFDHPTIAGLASEVERLLLANVSAEELAAMLRKVKGVGRG